MIRTVWTWFRRAILIGGVLLSVFAGLECLQAYQALYALHPWAGYVFVFLLSGTVLTGAVWFIRSVWSRPRVLRPPAVKDKDNPTARELSRYARYLRRYLSRLAGNPALEPPEREQAQAAVLELQQSLAIQKDLHIAIRKAEKETVQPLLEKLNEQAEREVRRCVRDVMAGVAFSPYQAIDLFIVFYRNFIMLGRIIKIFNSRPSVREQWRIISDICGVVATVNYIDMGRDLLEHLGARVPGIGKFVDDIAEGTGAGFMTSIVGHAAIHRCRAYRGWDEKEARESVCRNMKSFYGDVKDLFKKDVLPGIMGRVADTSRETWDKVTTALDETGNSITNFVVSAIRRKRA